MPFRGAFLVEDEVRAAARGDGAIHHQEWLVTRRNESSVSTRTAADREEQCARTKKRHQ